jgi:hypothetical protein
MENVGIFMTIWNILRPFGTFYGNLVQFVLIWYIFSVLVCLDREKSGNPFPNNIAGSSAILISGLDRIS